MLAWAQEVIHIEMMQKKFYGVVNTIKVQIFLYLSRVT